MTIQFKQLNTWHLNIKTPLVLPSSKIIINSFFSILNLLGGQEGYIYIYKVKSITLFYQDFNHFPIILPG